ncbi:MAG: UDP-N-acetylmuramoyl-tripeptide--D-alanyl-D-alanine ligase [Chlamydiales bacterium]|jgi:UDP-N-acetylmuramoyl-tripeptide--D-alanyl-D-alanine ligase|nr:UDP-N-acetylmuramoyl-tripeptide--D-alanyl-D-alanine ligase [Chlamydiales bacterium]
MLSLQKLGKLFHLDIKDDLLLRGASIDSRQVTSDSLFFAIKGARVDGHSFLGDVAAKGAKAAVVDLSYNGSNHGMYLLPVKNVTEALQKIGQQLLQERQYRVIAVTGSLGKTTTKEFVKQLLSKRYSVAGTKGNQNTQLTLPLTIINADPSAQFLVLEMGMTHTGNIAQLVSIAPPEIAVITNISYSHGVNFSKLEEIAKSKSEILSQHATKKAILWQETRCLSDIESSANCNRIYFSTDNPRAKYFFKVTNIENLEVEFWESGRLCWSGKLPFRGKHNAQNLLAAIACVREVGLDWALIGEAINDLKLPEYRLEIIDYQGVTIINDAYNNSSPDAACAALDSIPKPNEGGRRIVVLSEMRELGQWSRGSHERLAEYALSKVDIMLCIGIECEIMRSYWKNSGKVFEIASSREELLELVRKYVQKKDIVLFKGSKYYDFPNLIQAFTGETA